MAKKIIEVEIKNFRNITHEIIDFQGGKSMVITGKNEIGKTNRITAILWLLAGVLFDGTAKDNMSNLVPETAEPGTTVSVRATFDDGQSIEKQYSRQYITNENGEMIPKDSVVKFIVNGGKPLTRVSDGYAFINEQLGFTELENRFNSNKALKSSVNVAYLLLTTMAIRAFDNATMRALIIDIVGDVSAYDIANAFPSTYKGIIPLLERSNNDVNKVRDDLRYSIQDKVNGLEIRLEKSKGVLEGLELEANKKVDEIAIKNAKDKLAEIGDKISELELKKRELLSGSTNKIDLEISQLENKKLELERQIRAKYQEELDNLRNNDLSNQVRLKEDAYNKAISSVRVTESEVQSERVKLQSLNISKTTKQNQIESIRNQVKALVGEFEALENSKNNDTNKAFVTCNHCNQVIDLSETKEHKAIHNQHIEAEKKKLLDRRNALKSSYDEYMLELSEIELEITKQTTRLNQKTNENTTAINNRNTLEKELVELRQKLSEETTKNAPVLNFDTKEVLDIKQRIETLKTQKIKALEDVNNVISDINQDIDNLKYQRPELETIIDTQRVQQANLNALAPRREEHQKLSDELTKTKELYALSKELLVATFKELERRVEVKFGKDVYFKLYEPNASDGGATYKTSVCEMYVRDSANRLVPALANGVSTSMQEVRIVEFIERLKAHYGIGDSVILIDRLESLDEDKLAMLRNSGNQIITTAVVKKQDHVKYELL